MITKESGLFCFHILGDFTPVCTTEIIAFIGLIIGKFIAWCNIRIPENKKIFSIDFFKENKSGLKLNYVFMISIAVIYVFLLYKFGINKTDLFKNL